MIFREWLSLGQGRSEVRVLLSSRVTARNWSEEQPVAVRGELSLCQGVFVSAGGSLDA